ncbi:hypothetical protein GAY33_15835 [Azospirillum brasilense]|uniref:hypothetical protein n=1 Tax=Azospirillum argentinense TaxID=2970906 RepID=UPI00190D972A|nr:hypothetical protein [Azospirillum argentinense]MBK3800688.1 hypothetical protein [Azospirillum argentinense]
MNGPSDTVIERVKVREVAGVFRSPDALDAAADALLRGGFDRADIDLMAHPDTIREKLGGVYAPAEELADVPDVPRRAYIAHEDVATTTALVAGVLSYVGAAAAALGVVASGGTLALALAAAAAGGAAGGGVGALISRALGAERARELETLMAVGGLVLWVRVRTPEQEEKAQRILREHSAEAVRVHEIEIDKRLEDLPLASLRPDPWLSDEPLARP